MSRYIFALCAFALATLAWGQTSSPDEVNGGGTTAFGTGVRLSGAIVGYGLGGGTAGISQSATNRIAVGFYPSLGPIISRNVADPAWLSISAVEGRDQSLEIAAWRESEPDNHLPINMTGWQL